VVYVRREDLERTLKPVAGGEELLEQDSQRMGLARRAAGDPHAGTARRTALSQNRGAPRARDRERLLVSEEARQKR
jgi:hypothetical protein